MHDGGSIIGLKLKSDNWFRRRRARRIQWYHPFLLNSEFWWRNSVSKSKMSDFHSFFRWAAAEGYTSMCLSFGRGPKKHIKHTSQSENRSFGGVFPTYDSIHVTPPVSLFFFHDRWDIRVFPSRPIFFFSLSKRIGPCRNLVWLGGSQNE